ncbi:MAG TPA: sulfatase-like hydrolase/transferase [Thermoleophilaceae bacterium]|jgi:uncharacterized membrane protein YgcG|nr:sulfatase-like hydrolase/transferase [Thermoleophilaceae bacterium]
MASTGEAPPAEERSAAPSRPKEILINFGHLAALSAFALAQPLFSLLKKNPEFFAARGSPGFDIISFSILLVLLPPLALILIELLVGLVSRPASRVLHVAFVALGVGLIAAQALKKAIGVSDVVLIVLSVVIGIALALLYARTEGLRSFLTILSPVPIVFLVLFLFTTPISKLAFPGEAEAKNVGGVNRTNVVEVLFDEFPSTNLMDASHHVDAKRFPHFAELERDSTWFRNAYTVYDSTERAQPAIFDGNLPAKDKLPTAADHPNSIFTLMAKTHRLNVSEEATSVCPPKLCKNSTQADEPYNERLGSMTDDLSLVWLHVVAPPKIESKLPSVSQNWGNFGGGSGGGGSSGGGGGGSKSSVNVHANLNSNRNHRFEEWIQDIKPGGRPALNFKHSLIPHVPWQYLPDGKQYRRTASDPVPGLSEFEYDDQQQVYSLWQRHLLQVGFADRLLGELIAHLKKEGLYDKSLIVVAADHGVAFDLGARDRRTLNSKNYGEIAPIPLFMKAPGQKKGRINNSYVESIDILPTMFDILNLKPPVHMDGKSAYSETVKKRRQLRILQRGTFKTLHFPVGPFERRKDQILAKKLELFGTGSMFAPRFYHWGPHADLIGKPASSAGLTPLKVDFTHANEFKDVDLSSSTVPVHVVGRVRNAGVHRDVAIAINGKIVAVSSTFKLVSGDTKDVLVASMVPESAFHNGANNVQVLAVGG